jgi:hypothetical protein
MTYLEDEMDKVLIAVEALLGGSWMVGNSMCRGREGTGKRLDTNRVRDRG